MASHCGLFCMFLMISESEHFSIYLAFVCLFLRKIFTSFANFLNGLFWDFALSCLCSLGILHINPFLDEYFPNSFSHPPGCLQFNVILFVYFYFYHLCFFGRIQNLFVSSLFSYTVLDYTVLHLDLWSILIWFFYKWWGSRDLVLFFCTWMSSFPSTIY
jgi:hypothetical protein